MPRLFVAIDLPHELAVDLLRILPVHDGIRPTLSGQLHLTLRFLGERDEALAARVALGLRRVRASAMTLQVDGVGRFRSGRGAVLWAGLSISAPLTQLVDAIDRVLENEGIGAEARRFWPHLTRARCRPGVPDTFLRDWLSRHGALTMPPWRVDRFALVESFLKPDGARHAERETYPLATQPLVSPDC